MKSYLDLMGYTVEIAPTVAAARKLARTTEFDLLVCDIHLPDGTGWDLLKSLKAKQPIRAIAFSAYDEPDYRANSEAAGFLDYVVKGSPPELLVQAIERAAGEVVSLEDAPRATATPAISRRRA